MRKNIGKIKSERLRTRARRKLSIRATLFGNAEKPRVSVTKTNKNLFVQVIDDISSQTLFSVQTFGKNGIPGTCGNRESAKKVGAEVGALLKARKIQQAVFDRSGYKFTGVVAALAEGIRESGIKV